MRAIEDKERQSAELGRGGCDGTVRPLWQVALFVALPAASYALFFTLHVSSHTVAWTTWQLTMNAQSHAGVLGIFAGFIATVVVIVLTVGAADPHPRRSVCRLGAVGAFLSAFLHAILGCFQYASYAGLPEAWRNAGGGGIPIFPYYTFSLLGTEYLLAVYLCFYGLVLAVHYLTESSHLTELAIFMLGMVYLIGSAWLFLDFAASAMGQDLLVNMMLLGIVYTTPVVFAGALPLLRRLRVHVSTALTVLYISLAGSLLLGSVSGLWFARIAFLTPQSVNAASVAIWVRSTLWVAAVCGALLFGSLAFCLHTITTSRSARRVTA